MRRPITKEGIKSLYRSDTWGQRSKRPIKRISCPHQSLNFTLTHFKITNSHSKMILEGIHSQLSHSTRHYYILINLRRSNNVSACKNVVERLRWQFCNFLFCTTMFHCYTVLVNWARGIFANMNHSSKTMYM